jgi:hypothetical protein
LTGSSRYSAGCAQQAMPKKLKAKFQKKATKSDKKRKKIAEAAANLLKLTKRRLMIRRQAGLRFILF